MAGGEVKAVTNAVSVFVRAEDPLSRQSAEICLRKGSEISVLPAHLSAHADIILVLANRVTEEVLYLMETDAKTSVNPDMRIMLVTDEISGTRLIRAVGYGLVSVLQRTQAGFEQILQGVISSQAGRSQMPGTLMRFLVEELRSLQRDSSLPNSIGGFHEREIDLLRLLADGLDTSEIATRLNYSERTIKNIIFAMTRRLDLRNRTHAVAHAIRIGAL